MYLHITMFLVHTSGATQRFSGENGNILYFKQKSSHKDTYFEKIYLVVLKNR